MDIVIIGGGKVGEELCRDLSKENHNIVLIDKDPNRLEQLSNTYDIRGVLGNGAVYALQLEADTDKCDLFIAVTPLDEINIIAALTAKRIGAKYCVARVRNPDYSEQMHFIHDELGINLVVNPELEAARQINNIIRYPSALTVDRITRGTINLVSVRIDDDGKIANTTVRDYVWRDRHGLFVALERDDKVLIPKGDSVIEVGDIVYAVGGTDDLHDLYLSSGSYTQAIHSVMIVGGGRISEYLIPMLLKQGVRVKLIEVKKEKCDELSVKFPKVEIIFGDGTNPDFLREERITDYDAFIALTNIDEENIIVSIFASRNHVSKTITKVNRLNLMHYIEDEGIGSVITPYRVVSDIIIRYVRAIDEEGRSEIINLTRFADDRIEVIDFKVGRSPGLTEIPIQDLKLKDNLLLAMILRGNDSIIPSGKDMILPGDHIVIVTTHTQLSSVDDILKERS